MGTLKWRFLSSATRPQAQIRMLNGVQNLRVKLYHARLQRGNPNDKRSVEGHVYRFGIDRGNAGGAAHCAISPIALCMFASAIDARS